jgi:hypothetical protein
MKSPSGSYLRFTAPQAGVVGAPPSWPPTATPNRREHSAEMMTQLPRLHAAKTVPPLALTTEMRTRVGACVDSFCPFEFPYWQRRAF